MREHPIGKVTHVWPKAHAAAVHLDEPLSLGDRIRIVGRDHDIVQEVTSLEVEHEPHAHLWKGDAGSVGVRGEVHKGDRIFKLEPDERYPLFELQE